MIGLSWEEVNALVLKACEAERERIIKLLESHRLPTCNGDTDESGYCLTCNINLHDAVEIIKGENK